VIDDLAKFYVDAMVGAANLDFRDSFMTSGILGIGAATVAVIENSSGIGYDSNDADAYNGPDLTKPGFWDNSGSKVFRPKRAGSIASSSSISRATARHRTAGRTSPPTAS
jgi:hypothetical protein